MEAKYQITVFYDEEFHGRPTYLNKDDATADTRYTRIFLGPHGELVRSDLGDKWRKADQSGTGLRAGSARPPDAPADAFALLK